MTSPTSVTIIHNTSRHATQLSTSKFNTIKIETEAVKSGKIVLLVSVLQKLPPERVQQMKKRLDDCGIQAAFLCFILENEAKIMTIRINNIIKGACDFAYLTIKFASPVTVLTGGFLGLAAISGFAAIGTATSGAIGVISATSAVIATPIAALVAGGAIVGAVLSRRQEKQEFSGDVELELFMFQKLQHHKLVEREGNNLVFVL
jgi:hypothetical protein